MCGPVRPLLYEEEPTLPRGLMLIDTPDFDSILEDNRLASESLLTVADLVVAVVTRHSYQNKAVVTFLERWLQHGRPWMLVYNEAGDAEIARAAGKAQLEPDAAPVPSATLANSGPKTGSRNLSGSTMRRMRSLRRLRR